MRRTLPVCLALVMLASAAWGQRRERPQTPAPGGPPHAWLFGTWVGGLFPPAGNLTAETCFSQPVVIFTRDSVLRATVAEQTYRQRVVETARAGAGGVEFRFVGTRTPQALLDVDNSAGNGFGCESPDVLHVQRLGPDRIAFPGCAEFAYPLVRCHG